MDTGARKWGRPYLNRLFFSLLGERMADRVLLLLAREGRALDRRRAQPDRRRLPLRPQLGLPGGRAVPALRALLLPGHRVGDRPAASPASRPARRASTRSPAAICRPRSTPPTTSPTRPLRAPVARFLEEERRARAGRDGLAGRGVFALHAGSGRERRGAWPPRSRAPWQACAVDAAERRSCAGARRCGDRTANFGSCGSPSSPRPKTWPPTSNARLALRGGDVPFTVIESPPVSPWA